jgi:uncharacterized protein (TIGR00290 family)
MKKRAYFNWSGGKDSALALFKALQGGEYDINALLTSVSQNTNRTHMHRIPTDLLHKQAESIGIPLKLLSLSDNLDIEEYEKYVFSVVNGLKESGMFFSLFGDIFLEDMKRFREEKSLRNGLHAEFPLWGIPTTVVIREFLNLGFKAIVTCVDSRVLDQSFVGRSLDDTFINDLPDKVDICGENGEYHTFVFDGPLFSKQILFEMGEKYHVEYGDESNPNGFWFADVFAYEK